MAGVVGTPRSYHKKFNFAIEIDGLDIAWFKACSAIELELGIVEQHEGGEIGPADQSPGKLKITPVTLTVGVSDNDELWQWWNQVVDVVSGKGEPDERYKKTVVIKQLDRDGTERKRWTLSKAWPHKFNGGDWDATAEENVAESITLVYKRPTMKKAA